MKTEQERIKAMTKDEIKKALEICNDIYAPCNGCPYDINSTLHTDALKLINEQEKEIERLKTEFKQLQTNAEILARGVRDLNHENYELTEKVKQAKIDVLNELKERTYRDSVYYPEVKYEHKYVHMDDIDEMIEELEK